MSQEGKQEQQNALRVSTIPVNTPCEDCGSVQFPNLRYSLVGMSGVLCRTCLDTVVTEINNVLQQTKHTNQG